MKKKILNICLIFITIVSFIISITLYVYNEKTEPYYIYIKKESYKSINDFNDLNKTIEVKLNKEIDELYVSNPGIIKVDDKLNIIDMNIELSYSDNIWKYIVQIQNNDDDYVIIISKTKINNKSNEGQFISYLNVINVIDFFDYGNVNSGFIINISTIISYKINDVFQEDSYYFDGHNMIKLNDVISGVFCHITVKCDDGKNKIVYFLK